MSRSVADRLSELMQLGEERRHRTLEIRQRSSLALERVHHRQWDCRRRSTETLALRGTEIAEPEAGRGPAGILGQVQELFSGDVLDQAGRLLHELDVREREHWSEEDLRIFCCLEEAWMAAERKGYSLQDLQAVLRLLEPPE